METPLNDRVLKVLVVDDNVDAADSLAALLQTCGYAAEVAYDGASGLSAARAVRPDCLVSDIAMPKMDGYALARAVRAEPGLAGLKLVALSAYSDAEHTQRAVEAGFDYQLTKGSDLKELLEVLRMIDEVKELATQTRELAKQNVVLAGQAKELLEEVKDDIQEVKEDVKELKQEVKELKQDPEPPPTGTGGSK